MVNFIQSLALITGGFLVCLLFVFRKGYSHAKAEPRSNKKPCALFEQHTIKNHSLRGLYNPCLSIADISVRWKLGSVVLISILQRFFKSLLNISKILSDCHQIKTIENKFKRPVRSEREMLLDSPPLKKYHSGHLSPFTHF